MTKREQVERKTIRGMRLAYRISSRPMDISMQFSNDYLVEGGLNCGLS